MCESNGESTPLQRLPVPSAETLSAGLGCLAVPLDRLLPPGARRSLHLYDSSCMALFGYARAKCAGRFLLAALEPEAAAQRRFGLLPVACEVEVLKWEPSSHTNKFGDVSASIRAEVVGCARRNIAQTAEGVLQ